MKNKLPRKYYNKEITAWLSGWVTAKKHSGELMKDVKMEELDKEYTNILRITAHNSLHPDVDKLLLVD